MFHIVDIRSGLIVGFSYSSVSEMEAFRRAMAMAAGLGVPVNSDVSGPLLQLKEGPREVWLGDGRCT